MAAIITVPKKQFNADPLILCRTLICSVGLIFHDS